MVRAPFYWSRDGAGHRLGGGQQTAHEPLDRPRRTAGPRGGRGQDGRTRRRTIGTVTTSRAIAPNTAPPDLALLRAKRQEILRLAARHGASHVRVYGSVARGAAHPKSDIDLLVEFERGRSLVDEVELQQELELLLGYRVDLAEDVHHAIRDRVLAEALPL